MCVCQSKMCRPVVKRSKHPIKVTIIFTQKDAFDLLVSTHVVCERLSAIHGLPDYGMAKFLLILPRIPIQNLTTHKNPPPPPPPPKMKTWSEVGTLSFDYPRTPPPQLQLERVETNHCIPNDTISLQRQFIDPEHEPTDFSSQFSVSSHYV